MTAILPMADLADKGLLLDLLNTTPVVDGVQRDELGEGSTARTWLRAHGGSGTTKELARVRAVRAVLQGVVRGEEAPTALAPFLGSVSYRASVSDAGLTWALEAAAEDRLAARALLAWDRLRATAPGRLRPCANDECELYLIDRSKANMARWCSMAVCGNRAKARAYRGRRSGSQKPASKGV